MNGGGALPPGYEAARVRGAHIVALAEAARFRNQAEAKMRVFDFIEGWYNPHRRHSALGYESPITFERNNAPRPKQAA